MMLKISRAALVAALLSAPALAITGSAPAIAQETPGVTTNLSIPTITAVGSSMDEAALRDALTGNFAKHVTELAALNATSITIPQITFTMSVASGASTPATSVTSYKNIVLTNVLNGVAESASVESTSSTSADGTLALGKLSASAFDIGGLLGLYSLVPAGGAEQPMKVLYKNFSFAGGTFTGPKAQCTLGEIASAEFSARPLKVSFAELMAASRQLEAAKDAPEPPAAALSTVIGFLTDIFQAFKSEPITMDGLRCNGTGDTGEPFELAIGGLTMDGYAPGYYPAISVKNVKIGDGGKNTVSLDAATLKSIDLSGPIAVLEGAKDGLNEAWFEANARALIPAFAGLSFSGLKADVESPDAVGERINASITNFDVSLSNYVNGIPTTVSTSAAGVDVPLPADPNDETAAMFRGLGIERVTLGYKLDAAWDKPTQTINVNNVEFSGLNLGSVSLTGSIGNASDLLFSLNPQAMMMASAALTVKGLSLTVTDGGMGDIAMMTGARQQNMDFTAYRNQMGAALEGMVIQLFGSTDSARALGAAVSDFLSGRKKTLNITLTPVSPAGVPLLRLMAQLEGVKDPLQLGAALNGLVQVTGSAQ